MLTILLSFGAMQPGWPETAQDWVDKGLELSDNSDREAECYRKAIELDPKYAAPHFNLGYVLQTQGRNTDAAREYEACIALDPHRKDAYLNLGAVRSRPGAGQELEGARRAYNTLLERSAEDTKFALKPEERQKLQEHISHLEAEIGQLKEANPVRSISAEQFAGAMTRGFTRGASPYAGPRVPILLQFDYDSARLRPESQEQLRVLAEALKAGKMQNVRLLIEGHTDSNGSAEYNIHLSRDRAESVRVSLEQYGVPASRLQVKACGEDHPIAPNDTDEGKAKNRRVEFLNSDAWTAVVSQPQTSTRGGIQDYAQFYR